MAKILAAPTRWILGLLSVDTDRDFTRYHGYLDTLPVLYLEGQDRKVTATLQLRPNRTDTGGASEFETRTEFGDWFAQGDFSHGMGQRFFHRSGRDDAKYFLSEGFDVSEPGVLRHVNTPTLVDGVTFTQPRALAEFDGDPFVGNAADVHSGNALFPGSWANEDPNAGEGDTLVWDLVSTGEYLYAALGTNGVHRRDTAGVWDHFQPDGATDLDTGDTRIVRWLKDRLIVIGTAGRAIFEVVADSTPTAMETLATGWTFEDAWEAGPFIFATAVNPEAGLCRIHAYGLNSGGTAIEKKTSTPMPKGMLIYSGVGTQGRIFLGGGKMTVSGGLSSILLEGSANETGELQTLLIQKEDDDDTKDYAVRTIEVTEDSILFGWGRSSLSPFGEFVGIGRYNLARNAFSLGLKLTSPDTSEGSVIDLITFGGRILFTTGEGIGSGGTGFYYEDVDAPVSEAFIITSVADWGNASRKVWDHFELTHHALETGATVDFEYSKKNPDQNEWQPILTSEIPGAVGAEARVEDVVSRILALKVTSHATTNGAPEILSTAVRSMPAPRETEWRLVRTVRILDEDRKNASAEAVHQDPRSVRSQLHGLAHTFVTLYEPGVTWLGYVEDAAELEPGQSVLYETEGTSDREVYYVELRIVARRVA